MPPIPKLSPKAPKINQTVKSPERIAYPGIYDSPATIAAEAASRVAPESPNLKRLFGVNREELYEIGKDLRGNLPGTLPGAAENPRGSAAAEKIMTPKNVQRILDVNAEAEKYPSLVQGMDPWYVMTPYYKRMVELLGPEQAAFEYRMQNALSGMASPGSEVNTEIPRGSAAYFLHKQGRFPEFVDHLGLPNAKRGALGVAEDIINVPGHMYHKTAQAIPMEKFLRTGELDMSSPKVPMYIEASGVPEIGFQTQTPVGDAHWSRAVGLGDTRTAKNYGASVSNPEMTQLAPWWRDKIAAELGIESVPAQARTWGAFSGQTGVTTPIGAPKLELIADQIAATAKRLGVSLETARDMVMMGKARMGKAEGGMVESAPQEAIANTVQNPNAARMLDMDLANLALMNQPKRMAGGGAVKMEEGGTPERTPYDQMIHDQALARFKMYSQTKENPNDVPAPTIDDQRLELMNSPVIESTPQSPTQKAIGTLGGYMGQAGKYITDSLAPIADKNPIRTFMADMLLADPLKNAGAALQDYTKTSREYTEDSPYRGNVFQGSGQTLSLDPRVLDIAQFAQPAASAARKVAGAGAKAVAPFAKNTAEMAAELYARGQIPGMVSPNAYMTDPSVAKPSKVLAPANEQGFYSPTEAAALNLQRKSGQGQAFLNDIAKGENVKSDEINAMGLDTFLKGKTNVTADEVRDYIAQNKMQLSEAKYGELTPRELSAEWERLAQQEYGKSYGELYDNEAGSIEHMIKNDREPKFEDYSMPGGENYREIVMTLPDQSGTAIANYAKYRDELYSKYGKSFYQTEASPEELQKLNNLSEATSVVQPQFRNSHFDEPNVLSHLRVSDRVTDGKKTLLVDEVQSDWHQQGREHGYSNPEQRADIVRMMADEIELTPEQESLRRAYLKGKLVPDAPYKEDWYQLTLRRAIKEAIDGGYDRVALPTGDRVNERFDLSKQIDRIDYNKNNDGTYSMSAIKDGREVFSKEDLDEKELSGIVGKDLAKKIVGDEGSSATKADRWEAEDGNVPEFKSLSGLDLKIGGEGNKKYYDEIYPTYLKKFGKKYGSESGMTTVDAKGTPEPLFYMDITPAMRKEFGTGIHMKRGGKVQFANNIDAMRNELKKAK